jgi:hypothetical protein
MIIPPAPRGDEGRASRRRSRASIALDEVVRGASSEELARPAGEVLASVVWEGAAPDPEVLDAATFLAWL